MLTLSKKTWKYIFYAVIALVLLYVIFGSTRERFTSVNPLPTQADFTALEAVAKRAEEKRVDGKQQSWPQLGAEILKTAPESIKSAAKFSRANIIPLLPYNVVKQSTQPDGDTFDFFLILFTRMYKDILVLPLAYAVKQQSSPPTLPAFIDMVVKIVKDNAPGNQPLQINAEQQGLIDQAKKGETTMQMPNGDTYPNPGYWLYKYIYGDPKAAPSGPPAASSTTKTGGGGSIGGGGKCTPSLQQVPGGITETRCFN
jgi:hypothetical protein